MEIEYNIEIAAFLIVVRSGLSGRTPSGKDL